MTTTLNLNQKYEPILINFNIPKHLKYHLDRLSKFKGVSRTSILNRLIEEYVRVEDKMLEDDGRIYEMMSKLENTIEKNVLRQTQPELKKRSWEESYYDDRDEPVPFSISNDWR
jgi:metal-responsive CopG/Arc/MetJ family transcriptional regulator